MAEKMRTFRRLLVPGFVFQSIVIGGGYGTGAEIMEYFQKYGFAGGLLGIGVTLVIWSTLCAITFEFSRVFRVYTYQGMMSLLLRRGAVFFEISYLAMLLMVLGAVTASAGAMPQQLLGVSPIYGYLLLAICTVFLSVKGTAAIEKALSLWSYVLYAVYLLLMALCLCRFGGAFAAQLQVPEINHGWAASGAKYAFYNMGCVPLLLYTLRDCQSRREAVLSGLLGGVIGAVPAALLLVVLAGVPGTLGADIPVTVVFDALDTPWLYWLFEIVLFGTLIETSTGYIKALDDRICDTMIRRGSAVPPMLHAALAIGLCIAGYGVAQLGLSNIIAKGYSAMNVAFFLTYALPMATRGVWMIRKKAHV